MSGEHALCSVTRVKRRALTVLLQLLNHNRRTRVSEMTGKIDAVTAESLQRVALRVFGLQSGGKPTVLAMGRHDLGDRQVRFRKLDPL